MANAHRSNGYGDYRTTTHADQAAFDACPPPIRHALNYAVSSFASVPTMKLVREGFSVRAIIGSMRRGDVAETVIAYGPDHPEAGASE